MFLRPAKNLSTLPRSFYSMSNLCSRHELQIGLSVRRLFLYMAMLTPLASASASFAAGGTPLKVFLQQVERTTGRRVYVLELPPGQTVSRGGVGASGIYALMRPGASDDEVVHELMHSVLELEGYVCLLNMSNHPAAGSLCANLADFILHPLLDRRCAKAGFPQDRVAAAHATSLLHYLSSPGYVPENQMDNIAIAANAVGLAEVLQRGYGPLNELRTVARRELPHVYVEAVKLLQAFSQNPSLSPDESFTSVRRILTLLDIIGASNGSQIRPSLMVHLGNARREPNLNSAQEEFLRQNLRERR